MTTMVDRPLVSLWAEVTGKCQLECVHCYAGSSPDGTHGTMTADQWKAVLTEAAALGTRAVCFIGGEPTLYPDLPELVRHALSEGMYAEVYTNLVFVSAKMWELFGTPGVSVATSWYSSDREEHKQVTGRDTWRQTLANIDKAVQRGIPLRVGLIDGIVPGQHVQEGAALLREHGVTSIGTDYLREFGRGTTCDAGQACGNCGQGRAAVLPDGTVAPCPLTRWMDAGNVADAPLSAILSDVVRLADTIPAVQTRRKSHAAAGCRPDGPCQPFACIPDGNTGCQPDKPGSCPPYNRSALESSLAVDDCHPWASCKPDDCPPLNPPCEPDKAMVQQCTPPCEPADCIPEVGCPPTFCSPHCGPKPAAVLEAACRPDCRPNTECQPIPCQPEHVAEACPPNTICQPQMDNCRPDLVMQKPCIPHECPPDVCKPLTDACRPDLTITNRAPVTVTACQPDCSPYDCTPGFRCGPDHREIVVPVTVLERACIPDDCRPDIFCKPLCTPTPPADIIADCLPDDCRPDAFCKPLCTPSECSPNISAVAQGCSPDNGECQPDCAPMCAPACSPV